MSIAMLNINRGFAEFFLKKKPSFDGLHHSSKLATVAWGCGNQASVFFCREEADEIHQFYE